jgi:acetyl esterase/lipase
LAFVTVAAFAEASLPETNSTPIRLWPGDAPGERPNTIGPEAYTRQDILTNVTVPTITPYLVDGSDAAMIIAPGGGYKVLSMFAEGSDIAAWLNSIGVSAFVLKYRVPGRNWLPFGAAELMDAQRAVGLVRQMVDTGAIKGLNKSKVGFMGFSAGGHLTGHINVQWKTRSYPYMDAADKQSCRPDASIMVYPWESVTEEPVKADASRASAENITADTPRTMLVQTEDDPVHVENAFYYWLHLKQNKVLCELHLYPTGGHGYGRCNPHTSNGTESELSAKPGVDQVCTWPGRGQLFLQTVGIAPKTVLQAPKTA